MREQARTDLNGKTGTIQTDFEILEARDYVNDFGDVTTTDVLIQTSEGDKHWVDLDNIHYIDK